MWLLVKKSLFSFFFAVLRAFDFPWVFDESQKCNNSKEFFFLFFNLCSKQNKEKFSGAEQRFRKLVFCFLLPFQERKKTAFFLKRYQRTKRTLVIFCTNFCLSMFGEKNRGYSHSWVFGPEKTKIQYWTKMIFMS